MGRVGSLALGLLLLQGTAFADWEKLLGKEAPDVGTTWLRPCDGTTFDVLLGKAVVVVFWAAEGTAAGDDLFLISELHERIYQRGGRVLALTAAPADTTKAVLEAEGVLCPVGADTRHPQYGSGKLPYAYLVAPDRRVAWQGPFSSLHPSTLDPVVKRSKPFLLIPLSEENKGSADAFRKGMLVEASVWALEKAAREKKQAARLPALKPFAELYEKEAHYIRDMTELYRAYWWSLHAEGIERGDYDRASYGLDHIQRHLDGSPYRAEEVGVRTGDGRRAADEARKLDTPEVKRSLEASKALAAVVAQAMPATLTEKAKATRLLALDEFQKKWEGTYAARRAARRAKWVSGLPTKG
jgi:AhpC/TSA family